MRIRTSKAIYTVLGLNGKGHKELIVASRNGMKSTLIASNLLISQWYGLFDNQSMIIPTIDRFVERCDMVKINAQSYRYKTSEEKIHSLGE